MIAALVDRLGELVVGAALVGFAVIVVVVTLGELGVIPTSRSKGGRS